MSIISEARKFREQFVKLREMATDEMSLQVPKLYPTWKVGVDYAVGDRILYEDVLYKVLQNHTSQETWTPIDAPSLFAKVLIPDEDIIPEWVQPDSTNAYMKGDKVTHNGKTWTSDIDNNVWEPGMYGWIIDK
jgi:chitodextrinase